MSEVWLKEQDARVLLEKGDIKPVQVWQNWGKPAVVMVTGIMTSEVDCDALADAEHDEYVRDMEEGIARITKEVLPAEDLGDLQNRLRTDR